MCRSEVLKNVEGGEQWKNFLQLCVLHGLKMFPVIQHWIVFKDLPLLCVTYLSAFYMKLFLEGVCKVLYRCWKDNGAMQLFIYSDSLLLASQMPSKPKFTACMQSVVLHRQSGSCPLEHMALVAFKHTTLNWQSLVCLQRSRAVGVEAGNRAPLSTLHQILPRCSYNFIPQIADVFDQC